MTFKSRGLFCTKKCRSSKRFLALGLAAVLILMSGAPVFATEIENSAIAENNIIENVESYETSLEETEATLTEKEESEQPEDTEIDFQEGNPTIQADDVEAYEMQKQQLDQEEPLLFDAWFQEDGGKPEIYGVLSYIPAGTTQITAMYSYNGSDFQDGVGRMWDLTYPPGGMIALAQLCIGANDYPLTEYDKDTDRLSVKLSISCQEGDIETEAVEVYLDPEVQVPEFSAELIAEGENPGIYGTLSNIPEATMSISVMYSLGGEYFDFIEDSLWELNDSLEGSTELTQLCIKAEEYPLEAYLRGAINSIYVKLYITRYNEPDIETDIVQISHNITYPLPDKPPTFTARIERDISGYYQVNGNFTDFPPNVVAVRPMYSLDGQSYIEVGDWYYNDWYLNDLGTLDEEKKYFLENQLCVLGTQEPLKSYLAKKLDQFYIRLQITVEGGETYDTLEAQIRREVLPVLPDTRLYADFPFTMRAVQGGEDPVKGYGQYQITVKTDTTAEEIYSLLPDKLPVEVKIRHKDTDQFLASGIVQCAVTWKALPSLILTAGEALTLNDAVETLIVPEGAKVVTPIGTYILPKPLPFDGRYSNGEVRLVINVVGSDELPNVVLKQREESFRPEEEGVLALAFREKPSGATSIKAYFFRDEEDEWTQFCDLLDHRSINHNQAAALYGYVNLLRPDEGPLKDYLEGNIMNFSIGLIIENGIFDGERIVLEWPGNYNLPVEIIEPDSSEGNENDAGNGDNNTDGDTNGGMHPGIPEEDIPPAVISPPADTERSGDNGEWVDQSAVEQPEEKILLSEQKEALFSPDVQSVVPALQDLSAEQEQTSTTNNAQSNAEEPAELQSAPKQQINSQETIAQEPLPEDENPESSKAEEQKSEEFSMSLWMKIFILGIAGTAAVTASIFGTARVTGAFGKHVK